MTTPLTFWHFMGILACLIVSMGIVIIPFLIYLYRRDLRDRESATDKMKMLREMQREASEECHAFQRGLNTETAMVFKSVSEALNRSTEMQSRLEKLIIGGGGKAFT